MTESEHPAYTMPYRVTTEIEIKCPVEDVFTYVTNPENQVHWMQAVTDISNVSGPPAVDQMYTAAVSFLGKRFESTEQVSDFEPNKAYGWRTVSGPIHDAHHFTFESVDGGTKITMQLGVADLNFFTRLAQPLMYRSAERHQKHSLETLKDFLEEHGPDHPK